MAATLAYGTTSSCIVFASTSSIPDDEEWNTYLEYLRPRLKVMPRVRGLVYAEGSGPTSVQRSRLNELLKPYAETSKTAVLTSSRVSVGIVTAMSWFIPGFRAFLPQNIDDALAYLEVPLVGRKEVISLLESLQRQLGIQVTLGKQAAAQ